MYFGRHKYVVSTGSKIMVTLKYLMAFKEKSGYNEGKQLHNHKNNSKIYYKYYNNYGFPYLPTSTKCNLSPIQTNQSEHVQLSLQLHMTELSFPFCNIIIMCSKFTITINISGFSPHAHNERNRQNPFLIT